MPDSQLPARPSRKPRSGVKHLSLALQGGGSHGAFTWGVMHRLISDPRLYIDGISGASAGAVNAVVFADGFRRLKRQGAIDALDAFWNGVSKRDPMRLLDPYGTAYGDWRVDAHPAMVGMSLMSRMFSPYQFNPFDLNPLRDVLAEVVDFEGLRQRPDIKLFVTCSNVRTCKSKLFRTPELRVETLLASACLPLLFKAVEIEGEFYWDGGYLGNPSIPPLIHECHSSDIVIVQISPMVRNEVPTTAPDILNRINEMSFNASLIQQMLGIATISRLIEKGKLEDDRYTTVRFHQIGAEAELAELGALSRLNTDPKFLKYLHDLGYDAADAWLAENFERIGWESTLDVIEQYGSHEH